MQESDFVSIAVDDLLRCPRNRNAGTDGGHHDEIAPGPAREVADVAIVRQNLWPEPEVGGRFEDIALWRIDDDRVRLVHDGGSARANPRGRINSARSLATKRKVTMPLLMKPGCEKCGRTLSPAGLAFICSYECTFCAECTEAMAAVCPNCGGELVRRPRRGKILPPL